MVPIPPFSGPAVTRRSQRPIGKQALLTVTPGSATAAEPELYRCSHCKEYKPRSAFGTAKGKPRYRCRECDSTDQRERRTRLREERWAATARSVGVDPNEDRICSRCHETKPASHFSRQRDTLHSWCRLCTNEANRRYQEKVTFAKADLTAAEVAEYLDRRAAPAPNDDYHWRWLGPRATTFQGGRRVQFIVARAIGVELPDGVEFWCADEFPGCCNPDHTMQRGTLPTLTDAERFEADDGYEGGYRSDALAGWQIVTPQQEESPYRAFKRLEKEKPDMSDPATRFLFDHGYNDKGEPLKFRIPKRKRDE